MTRKAAWVDMDPILAVSVATPGETPLTTVLEITATILVSAETTDAEAVRFDTLPFVYVPITIKRDICPWAITALVGKIVRNAGDGAAAALTEANAITAQTRVIKSFCNRFILIWLNWRSVMLGVHYPIKPTADAGCGRIEELDKTACI